MGVVEPEIVGGRYAVYDEIASGGMASVHFGCQLGAASFSRAVAIKRLHAHLAREHEFVAMFLDEARVASRIRHLNVVPTLDVVVTEGELFLVMEYVHGEPLSRLLAELRAHREAMSVRVACAIVVAMLQGLQAAHEATNERGESLGIVHRDVSPQNVIVGLDGVARMADFGVAMATGRLQTTKTGQLKGKYGYMAPEQVRGGTVTRAADIYSAAVVMWEALTGMRLFAAANDVQMVSQILSAHIEPPSRHARGVTRDLDSIVMCALERDPSRRFETARDMARAIEATVPIATASEVGEWVEALAGAALSERAKKLARIEEAWAARLYGRDRRMLAMLSTRTQHEAVDAAADRQQRPSDDATRVEGVARARRQRSTRSTGSVVNDPAVMPRARSFPVLLAIASVAFVAAVPLLAREHIRAHDSGANRPSPAAAPPEDAEVTLSPPAAQAWLPVNPAPKPRASASSRPPASALELPSAAVSASGPPSAVPATVPVDALPRVLPSAQPCTVQARRPCVRP